MEDQPNGQAADQVGAEQGSRDHTLRLLHRYHGPGDTEASGGDGAQVYHLPHSVVGVAKQMVAAAVARDAVELESYEAKAEEAVEYLRHKRP